MTKAILEKITKIEDLLYFSKAYKEGLININISKLARELGKDFKTVKRYLNGETPKKTRNRVKYLDEHREYILEVLSDKNRSFDYMDHLFKYLKREKGITCTRTTLSRYIYNDEELSKYFKRQKNAKFTERFETKPGEQAQFDLKERVKTIDDSGNVTYVNIPTLTLSWSRYNFRDLVIDMKTEVLLSFLVRAFEEIGGVPRELVIDNLKQFVEKPRTKHEAAILTNMFSEFAKDYGFKVKPCMPYRPQTKGKTETQNKIMEQLKNYNGKYKDLDSVHDIFEVINNEDNDSISQATKFPRRFLLEKEKGDLLPLPSKEIRKKYHLTLNEVTVSNESLISYKSNKYSVPKKYIGLKVGLAIVRDSELHIYYNEKIVTIHKITNNLLNIKIEHKLKYNRNNKDTEIEIDNSVIINEMRNINYD